MARDAPPPFTPTATRRRRRRPPPPPQDYPLKPPSCYFLQPTPRHPHCYSNGDICLSLLGKGWRPNLSAQHIALSILSMLSSVGLVGRSRR
jgi:hypothetical protein